MTDSIQKIAADLQKSLRSQIDAFADPLANFPVIRSSATEYSERMNEILGSIRSAPQARSEDLQEAIKDHIESLQAKKAADEQVMVYYASAVSDAVIITNIGFPNWHTVILYGMDSKGNETSVLAATNTIQLVCKIVKLEPPNKAFKIGFILPPANKLGEK